LALYIAQTNCAIQPNRVQLGPKKEKKKKKKKKKKIYIGPTLGPKQKKKIINFFFLIYFSRSFYIVDVACFK